MNSSLQKYRFYIIAGIAYVILALLVIHFSPIRITLSDVPIDIKQADYYLAHGLNPYGQNYTIDQRTNPYNPGQNHIETVQILQYPPMMILYYLPFSYLGIDIRYGNLLADIIIYALIISYFSQKEFERKFAFLFLGNGLNFIVNYYYGGNDIVAGLFVAISIYLLKYKGMEKLSALGYGISLVTKQLSLLLMPYFLYKAGRKAIFLGVSILAALVIFIPFLPKVFYDTVLGIFYSRMPLISYLLIFYPFFFIVVVERYAPRLHHRKNSVKTAQKQEGSEV